MDRLQNRCLYSATASNKLKRRGLSCVCEEYLGGAGTMTNRRAFDDVTRNEEPTNKKAIPARGSLLCVPQRCCLLTPSQRAGLARLEWSRDLQSSPIRESQSTQSCVSKGAFAP